MISLFRFLDLKAFSSEIIEHMLAGVGINGGGDPEIVEHAVNVYLFPFWDSGTLGLYLVKVARCLERRKEMNQQGMTRANDDYTIDGMLDGHGALYTEIILEGGDINA